MDVLVTLLAIALYGLAGFLWWYQQSPVYFLALLSGQIGALVSPLWGVLYNEAYHPNLAVLATLGGQPLYTLVFFGSSWFYSLPVLVVFFLYRSRWWFPGYFTALITYGVFVFYHTVLESIGIRAQLWRYPTDALPFGLSSALLSTLMAALVSLGLLYVILTIRRYSWLSMLLFLLPATLLVSLLVRGLIGAPLWIVLSLSSQDWAISIGALILLGLLALGIHVFADGVGKLDLELA